MHQLGEVHSGPVVAVAIRVDVLAEYRDFFEAGLGKLLTFGEDALHGPPALAGARKRHATERAPIVASARDRHERGDAIRIVPDRRDVSVSLLARQVDVDSGLARLVRHIAQTREVPIGIGPDDDINKLLLLEQLVPKPLGHTSEHAQLKRPTLLPYLRAKIVEPAAHLLLGVLTDRARVQ